MKKFIAILLAALMAILLAACADGGKEQPDTKAPETGAPESEAEAGEFGEAVSEEVFIHDGATKVTDAAHDGFFEGTAAEGVVALLNAGRVSINGIPVPATEDEVKDYQVNMVSALYNTDSGWGYNVHKTTSANNLGFEQARIEFLECSSTPFGYTTTFGLDKDGHCVSIDIQSLETMRISYFENHGGTVDKIDRGDFELDKDRIRYDANNITVAEANWDAEIAMGDVVIYYYSADGWHADKAVPLVGTLVGPEKGKFSTGGGEVLQEANVSRYNLISYSRPTQFYTCYKRLGLEDVEITTWCTKTNNPIGFTYGDSSKEALTKAIENAKALKEGVQISADGAGLAAGTKWVTQEAMDEFVAAIAAAEAVLNNNSSSNMQLDAATGALGAAWGEGGEKPSGFVGATGEVQ
ncbi:MAG: hypothetical protein ACOX75_04455 [Lachnospiraceae bacterium]|jgi:hypothetical protein